MQTCHHIRTHTHVSPPLLRRHILCLRRMAGARGAQLRAVLSELRAVCQHAHVLPEFEPERPGEAGEAQYASGADKQLTGQQQQQQAALLESLLDGSGKLRALDTLLQELHAQQRQALVMAHTPKVILVAAAAAGGGGWSM